ncbi:uncharacterized protein LOC126810353 isoform X1 [Patella vulgata]|uniref:uncharacterized protein LOC126810353 isoform X1 n=1 Tax=Patella vulgata TaxID=6465 RepID=UPI00217F8255|nr:uncharacterized protein LOC126810353 isoform X1 [Patella vulgata]
MATQVCSNAVKLFVYDISKGLAKAMSMPLLGKQIDGVWHTGIVVYGEEYYFGGTGGIECCPPCGTILGQPDNVIDLGETQIPKETFLDYLNELSKSVFSANKYNLFEHNCNNFSDEVAEFLTGKRIPSYITSLPAEVLNSPLGAMMKPMLDTMNVQPTGGHTPFASTQTSYQQPPSKTVPPKTNTTPSSSSDNQLDISQIPISFYVNIEEHKNTLKGEEVQGTIKSATSDVGLNLWNEILEYLQIKNPTWSLSKDHLHILGQILCDQSIKTIAWQSTCYMLQNLLLLEDFIPVVVNSSENTLGEILSTYTQLSPERKSSIVKVLCNVLTSRGGRNMLFGPSKDVILSKHCVSICCNNLLDASAGVDLLQPSAALAFNISLAEIDGEVEIEMCSAITTTLQQNVDENTAVYLLSFLLRIMRRNNEVISLVALLGCQWPNLNNLSEKVKSLHSSVEFFCAS